MMRTLVVGVVLAVTSRAYADANGDRFAAAVQDYTRDDHRAWVINRLMKFNLGAKCWAKVAVPGSGAVEAASYAVSDVVDYAKANGGGDWSAMEQNKRQLAAAMDAFRARFFVTVNVDGDDCDGDRNSPWIRYWGHVTGAIEKFPFPGGKVFAIPDVSSKHKAISVEVGSDGSTVTIHAPKDREAKNEELIEQTFKKIHEGVTTAAGGIDAFAFSAKESSHNDFAALIITKLHTFNIGKKCMAKLSDRKQEAVYFSNFVTGAIARWASRTGSDDWEDLERQARDRGRARDEIAADIAELRKRFSVTVNVEGDDCDTSLQSPWLTYWKEGLTMLEGLPPKSTKVAITITATAKAKDVTVAIGNGGASYVITGPRDRLPTNVHSKIEEAFMKVAKDRGSVEARVQNNKDSKLAKAGGNPFPRHGVPLSDAKIKGTPDYARGTTYTKGAEVQTGMSSNPHTLVFRCIEMKCTDAPGVSSQWKSVGWANAD